MLEVVVASHWHSHAHLKALTMSDPDFVSADFLSGPSRKRRIDNFDRETAPFSVERVCATIRGIPAKSRRLVQKELLQDDADRTCDKAKKNTVNQVAAAVYRTTVHQVEKQLKVARRALADGAAGDGDARRVKGEGERASYTVDTGAQRERYA